MIEATRRLYGDQEQRHLVDLFGRPPQWAQTLHALFWANTLVLVPSFLDEVTVDLQVPCTYDFNVSTTKYFAGLRQGEVPLSFLFSGTVFYEGGESGLRVSQIPWEKEARFGLPVCLWQELMDRYYPNSNWLCLARNNFERLNRYRMDCGLPTCEAALEKLLDQRSDVNAQNGEHAR